MENDDHRHGLTRPAVIVAAGLVLASIVFAGGVWLALDRSAARLESALADHAAAMRDAGGQIGPPVEQSMRELSAAVRDAGGQIGPPLSDSMQTLAGAVGQAGQEIASPTITMTDPIAVDQPVTIRGPTEDGALPVNARVGGSGEQDAGSRTASEREQPARE